MLIIQKTLFFFFLSSLLIASTANSTNNENQYLLQQIAQAPQVDSQKDQWLLLLEQPGNSQHYYLASKQGKIYQLKQDNPDNTSLLVDLQSFSDKNPLLQLSAFTLHPNFSLRGQTGFGTFYTAHIEKAPNDNNITRLLDPAVSLQLSFDAVVTEWQLNLARKIDKSSQREVLRVAIPTLKSGIRQLAFNPYSKSWHEDFSQLYIALSQDVELKQHPLYSGAILRIHPEKNATKSYSVPHKNPYYANDKIDKTIYLFGAGQINKFIWPNRHATSLLISHEYSLDSTKKHWLSYSNGGDDWRQHAPKIFLLQSEQPATSLLAYQGRNALTLRNKLLFLSKNKQQWQLNSLPREITAVPTSSVEEQNTLTAPSMEWQLKQPALQANHLTLYSDNRGDLLFFNEDSGALYQLFQQNIVHSSPESEQASENIGLGGFVLFLIIILSLLGLYIVYRVNIRRESANFLAGGFLVSGEFSSVSLTEDKLALNLFKRHQRDVAKVIMLADIKQCQVLLSDVVIATINTTPEHGFNTQQEQALREIFHKEQVAKMIDGKVRRISLSLNSQEKNKAIICLYLRKGNDRITKRNYFTVVDDTINWCWLIAQEINAAKTGERSLKPKVTATDIAPAKQKKQDDRPLHTQAAHSRSAPQNDSIITNESEQAIAVTTPNTIDESVTLVNHYDSAAIETAKVETELVNALEKLVKLRQQGFLTADEFEQAKAKLYHFN